LFLLAFATLGGITGKNPMKTVIAATLGIMISTVGIDISTGTQRYTFGVLELYEGIDFILAIVEFLDADSHRVHYVRRPFRSEPPADSHDAATGLPLCL
jgi:TctA family transporter